jgi:hypothetical protein
MKSTPTDTSSSQRDADATSTKTPTRNGVTEANTRTDLSAKSRTSTSVIDSLAGALRTWVTFVNTLTNVGHLRVKSILVEFAPTLLR